MKKDKYIQFAVNYYRTKKFIVRQEIFLAIEPIENRVVSKDIFYFRNKKRDKIYESAFKDRDFIDGKRIHSTLYTRRYVK